MKIRELGIEIPVLNDRIIFLGRFTTGLISSRALVLGPGFGSWLSFAVIAFNNVQCTNSLFFMSEAGFVWIKKGGGGVL